MNTKLVKVEKEYPDLQIMKEAGEILKNGGLCEADKILRSQSAI